MRDLLLSNTNIIDLSLNGNPNIKEEISKVIEGTNIAVLSLASCKINDSDVSLVSKELRKSNQLLALNVSSNNITDEGLNDMIDALRENRCLKCLNLADNYITANGCADFLKILQKFSLNHEEIVFRRERIFQRLKKISAMVNY